MKSSMKIASQSVTPKMEAFNKLMQIVGGKASVAVGENYFASGKIIRQANRENAGRIVSYLLGTAPVGKKIEAVELCVSTDRQDFLKQVPLEQVQNKELKSAIDNALAQGNAAGVVRNDEFYRKVMPG